MITKRVYFCEKLVYILDVRKIGHLNIKTKTFNIDARILIGWYSLASQSERVPQSCFYVKVAYLSHGENIVLFDCLVGVTKAYILVREDIYIAVTCLNAINIIPRNSPCFLQLLFGVKIRVCGDKMKRAERCLITANHRTRLDWMFMWSLMGRVRWSALEKIILRGDLRHVPGFGIYFVCFFYCITFIYHLYYIYTMYILHI